eukprot:m.105306 g.105306  ORF g.105306 m.105306 type:complete len:63 (-) comp16863_c0_seq4:393-581(-)
MGMERYFLQMDASTKVSTRTEKNMDLGRSILHPDVYGMDTSRTGDSTVGIIPTISVIVSFVF